MPSLQEMPQSCLLWESTNKGFKRDKGDFHEGRQGDQGRGQRELMLPQNLAPTWADLESDWV